MIQFTKYDDGETVLINVDTIAAVEQMTPEKFPISKSAEEVWRQQRNPQGFRSRIVLRSGKEFIVSGNLNRITTIIENAKRDGVQ